MTALNKQALREAAQEATVAHARLSVMPADDIFDISQHEGTQLDADITALNAFNEAANPATVLALLDELEAAEKRIAEHNFENRLLANADRDIKALRQRIDELSASHSKLRDTMAAIYNAICENGASTSLSTILTFVKRSREESSTAAGIGVRGD
ncbi:ead/Ea22-like family protein [Citrobacter freundii]